MIYLYTFRPNHFHTTERLVQTFHFEETVQGHYVRKCVIFARRNQILLLRGRFIIFIADTTRIAFVVLIWFLFCDTLYRRSLAN